MDDEGGWYYEMQALGFNYRIADAACALGHSQLKKLDGFIARRREIAAQYDRAFASLPGILCARRASGTSVRLPSVCRPLRRRDIRQ